MEYEKDNNALTNSLHEKYEGRLICELPVSYLEWFHNKGFPKGKLGMLLETMHVIKTNGLDDLLKPLRNNNRFSG